MAHQLCGLSLQEFLQLTPVEFGQMLSQVLKLKEQEVRTLWEIARFQAWLSVTPHLKKGSAPKSPDKLVKFDWERKVDKEELEDLRAMDLHDLIERTFKPKHLTNSNG